MKLFRQKETYISEKIKFTGDIEADTDITIDGEMFGQIKSSKHVSLGATSRFEGNVESDSALVCGYVRGSITTVRTLEVRKPATVVGDLTSAMVKMDSGVVIQGKITTQPVGQPNLLQAAAPEEAEVVPEQSCPHSSF